MKQQVLIIHGGETFKTYDDYLLDLANRTVDLQRFRNPKSWKQTIRHDLGERFDVLTPSMPTRENAKYVEWKMMMDKIKPHLQKNVILIGHSLGGIFLAKYLSNDQFMGNFLTYKAAILISAPYSDEATETLGDFTFKNSPLFQNVHLFHSKDDPIVPYAEVTKYQTVLPESSSHIFSDKGHFNTERFPELVSLLKSLL